MEFNFQKIVLIVAVVILLISLTVIGYMMYGTGVQQWPPSYNVCPDYWDVSGSYCIATNYKNVGSIACSYKSDNASLYDISCGLLAPNGNWSTDTCADGWSAGADVSSCYLTTTTTTSSLSKTNYLQFTPFPTMSENSAWVQNYGISWDGIN